MDEAQLLAYVAIRRAKPRVLALFGIGDGDDGGGPERDDGRDLIGFARTLAALRQLGSGRRR